MRFARFFGSRRSTRVIEPLASEVSIARTEAASNFAWSAGSPDGGARPPAAEAAGRQVGFTS